MSKKNTRRFQHEATTRPIGINNRADVQGEWWRYVSKQVIGAFLLFPLALVTAATLEAQNGSMGAPVSCK